MAKRNKTGFKFFDETKNVLDSMADAQNRAFARYGRILQLTMQRSMRRRKKASKPGQPPSSHGVGLLRKLLFFGLDSNGFLVVGPMKLNKPMRVSSDKQTIPEALEQGATLAWKARNGTLRNATMEARPFAAPAQAEHTQKNTLAKLYKDTMRK